MPKSSDLALVCPNSERLLGRLSKKSLVVRVSSINEIEAAYDRASSENHVHCIMVQEREPLSAIGLREEWKSIPLSFHVPEMGDLKRVQPRGFFKKRRGSPSLEREFSWCGRRYAGYCQTSGQGYSLLRLHICLVFIKGDTTVASAQPDSNDSLF